MEQMLAWTLIKREFAKVRPLSKAQAEDLYYRAFAGWRGSFRGPLSQ